MPKIEFPKEDTDILTQKLQKYCAAELDVDLGDFDAQFLLDFIAKEMGSYFYNQGIYDAQALLHDKVEEISESLGQLEQAVS